MLILAAMGLLAASTFTFSLPAQEQVPEQAQQSRRVLGTGNEFTDRFETLDRSTWAISDGWTNGPYMVNDWRRTQVVIDRGMTLTLQRNPVAARGFSSGETQSRKLYGHGYYETRMQAARGDGIISGFFTYTGPPFGQPWNEIDVEILGKDTRKAQFTYFHEGKTHERTVDLGFDSALGLHHYAFDWQPGYIRWYVDGQLVHEQTGAQLPLPYLPQKIMFHLWGTDTQQEWAGFFDAGAVPSQMRIDCVAYSQRRPATNKCGEAARP